MIFTLYKRHYRRVFVILSRKYIFSYIYTISRGVIHNLMLLKASIKASTVSSIDNPSSETNYICIFLVRKCSFHKQVMKVLTIAQHNSTSFISSVIFNVHMAPLSIPHNQWMRDVPLPLFHIRHFTRYNNRMICLNQTLMRFSTSINPWATLAIMSLNHLPSFPVSQDQHLKTDIQLP